MSGRNQLQRALLDAATILSSAANVARRAASSIDADVVNRPGGGSSSAGESSGSTSTLNATRTTPWPSQSIALQRSAQRREALSTSVPPSAPDGSLTEMKVLNEGSGRATHDAQSDDLQSSPDVLRDLDSSLKGYFGGDDTEAEIQGRQSLVYPTKSHSSASSALQNHGDSPFSQASSQSIEHTEVGRSTKAHIGEESRPDVAAEVIAPPAQDAVEIEDYDATRQNFATPLKAAKVPSSRMARLLHYGSLGAGLAWGAAGSYLSGGGSAPGGAESKQFMSDDNVRRLVDKLSTMRGAALKIGQFMSIQDSNLLPEQIEQIMLRVQNSANYMPAWQMEKVMREDLGPDWRSAFSSFEDIPFASASIGQVHAATVEEDHPSPLAGQKVAVKVQFPGVRESIGSDLSNLRWLVSASALLPKGLFLDNTIRVMRRELDDECDYEREMDMCKRFGTLLNGKSDFAVPRVVEELCSKRVLTCEMMKGRPLTQASRYPQDKRDAIARSILLLSLRELFTFRLMQTDPNWTNFLYNERTGKIELIDFGATREYDKAFMDDWLCMLRAAVGSEREECVRWSEKVGYLTGEETREMRDAHVDSMIALGEPFRPDAPNPYPFAQQTITTRVRAQIPLMLRQRLTPPPEPTYSLNRKLSGAFLLCARLKANVACRSMLEDVTSDYVLDNQSQGGGGTVAGVGLGKRGIHTMRSSPILFNQWPDRRNKRPQRPGNLGDRWPRHIVEAVQQQDNKGASNDDFTTLASTPVTPSMTTVPPVSTEKVDPSDVDLRATPAGGEKAKADAESPKTAMDLAITRGKQSHRVRGISIPKKPDPPGPEDCCMSGCARCVYDLYAEDLQDYQKDLSEVRSRLMSLTPPLSHAEWDDSLLGTRPAEKNDRSSKSAEEKAQDEVDAVIGKLDPSMKAFLQLERSLKKSGKHSTSNANT